jgi:hypothetical protein
VRGKGGWGQGGEMNQALCAHMNNKKKKRKGNLKGPKNELWSYAYQSEIRVTKTFYLLSPENRAVVPRTLGLIWDLQKSLFLSMQCNLSRLDHWSDLVSVTM